VLYGQRSEGASGDRPRADLIRGLGLWAAISVNVANMIGTGVFLKTRVMTCNVGTPGLVLGAWIAAGLLALAGTFSYAEVSVLMPEAGGDYVFLRRAYGRLTGFLYGWMCFGVARAGSQAALAVSFAIFLNVAVGGGLDRDVFSLGPFHLTTLTLVALGAIWVVAIVNCRSVRTGGALALGLTVVKVMLAVAVALTLLLLATGDWHHYGLAIDSGARCEGVAATARGGMAGFGAAMIGALWAYDGWSNVAPLAGEVKDPSRNLPRAFVSGMLVVGALYIVANVAYFYALTPTEIGSVPMTSSVATEALKRTIGPVAVMLIALVLMLSSLGSLHASVLANSRIPYAMAREGLFFRRLAGVSEKTHVPVPAILAQSAWASVLTLLGSYDSLTDSVIFASWLFYGLSAGSLFVFRKTLADEPRAYRALGYPVVPALFIVVTIWLLANTFQATPALAMRGVLYLVLGLPFYAWWSRSSATPS
jgi:basic amino acid/polyamine antiporter, APA family